MSGFICSESSSDVGLFEGFDSIIESSEFRGSDVTDGDSISDSSDISEL